MLQTELGNLAAVSPMPPLTSVSSAYVNNVKDCLTSSVSLAQCTPQKTIILKNIYCISWKKYLQSRGNFKQVYRGSENFKEAGKE